MTAPEPFAPRLASRPCPTPPRSPARAGLASRPSSTLSNRSATSTTSRSRRDGTRVAWSEKARDGGRARAAGPDLRRRAPGGEAAAADAAPDGKARREQERRVLAGRHDDRVPLRRRPRRAGPDLGRARRGRTRRGSSRASRASSTHPRWSPDGRSIAVLFVEGSDAGARARSSPTSPTRASSQEKIEEQRIAVVDAATGQAARRSRPPTSTSTTTTGRRTARRSPPRRAQGSGTNNYWIAELYVVDAASGQARSIWKPPLQIACPRFSPDGKSIAVIHGIMSDEGSNGGDVWLVPAAGGERAEPDAGHARRPRSALAWRSTGEVLFTENVDGESGVATRRPADAAASTTLWSGAAVAHELRVSPAAARASAAVHELLREAAGGLRGRARRLEAGHDASTRRSGRSGARRRASTGRATARASRDGCSAPPRRRSRRGAIRWSSSSTAVRPRRSRRRAGRRAGPPSCPSQGYYVLPAEPARQLRPRRGVHRRATSRTSATATCATSSPASTRSLTRRARRPGARWASRAGATAAT